MGSWERIRQLLREQGAEDSGRAAFTPDGKLLGLTVAPSLIELRDTSSWEPLARLEAPESDPVSLSGFTPDGGRLVVARAAGGVRVWDLRRIREQLKKLGLDWNMPPFPPEAALGDDKPLRIEVDLGAVAFAKQ